MKQMILAVIVIVLSYGSVSAKVDYMDTYNMQRAFEEAEKENNNEAISFFDVKEEVRNRYQQINAQQMEAKKNRRPVDFTTNLNTDKPEQE
jgi:sortase (surface protein transpeptidase)